MAGEEADMTTTDRSPTAHRDAAPATTVVTGPLRWPLAAVMVVHGLIHAMGVAVLFELGEPGDLTYADSVLEPGSAPALAAGTAWALAGLAFLVAGALLVARAPAWWPVAVAAAIVSLPLMFTAVPAPAGVVANVVILAAAGVDLRQRRQAGAR